MKTFDEMKFHKDSEDIVRMLCEKTQNNNPLFFRVQVAYYFCLVASMMRSSVVTHDRGDIPINMYALNLGTSGSGKGYSTNIIEQEIINRFRTRFIEQTFPLLAETNLPVIANKRAVRKQSDPDLELERTVKEFDSLGTLVFSFDSGTSAAVKQLRHKLLMADGGSMNLQIDEIGSNLLGNVEVLNTFLELFDVGLIKTKLIKNSAENVRSEEIVGKTPTNMLLFGTPSKLLDGGKTEEELFSMLETGYARRCFFGWSKTINKDEMSVDDIYTAMTNKSSDLLMDKFASHLEALADIRNVRKRITMSVECAKLIIEYRLFCEKRAKAFAEHEEVKKAEISHRYFKVLKLAGAYTFIDDSPIMTEDHIYAAIKLAEESGEAFVGLFTRERSHVKLAKYIANSPSELTQADLIEDLPFYRGSSAVRDDMVKMAVAWGYKNSVIVKKSYADGIEFFKGETLIPTDLNKLIVSYSNDLSQDYVSEFAPFDKLDRLTSAEGLHWVNHHLIQGHRQEENAIPGFNLIVIDVDGSCDLKTARSVLEGYKYLMYTTKRHGDPDHGGSDRFRIILPMNYTLKLDGRDYKDFMKNIFEWLPFEVDDQVGQRARKWLSHKGQVFSNDGEFVDVLPFIPKTSKNDERKAKLSTQSSLNNLERWVLNNLSEGRNNMLLRYAMILVDAGFELDQVQSKVMDLNEKLEDKLDERELMSTVMVTVIKQISKK